MLGDFGEVYLLDWGLAKLLGDAQDRLNKLRRQDPARIIADAQRGLNDATQSAAEAQDNLNRLRDIGASPREIAGAMRFILAAPAMTGQMIALDGGQHLGWAQPQRYLPVE